MILSYGITMVNECYSDSVSIPSGIVSPVKPVLLMFFTHLVLQSTPYIARMNVTFKLYGEIFGQRSKGAHFICARMYHFIKF